MKDVISRQVKQLGRLIDDLLDVSRITRGKIELRKRKPGCFQGAQPGDRIGAATHRAAEPPPHRRLRTEPLRIEADPTRLEQIVVNLLTNAAKYTHPRRPNLTHGGAQGSAVVIRVLDNGIGIPPEKLPSHVRALHPGRPLPGSHRGRPGDRTDPGEEARRTSRRQRHGKGRGPDTGIGVRCQLPRRRNCPTARRKHRDIVAGTAQSRRSYPCCR